MSNILNEINNRISEKKKRPDINEDEIRKCEIIESFINNPEQINSLSIEHIFGILEFLGYDQNTIVTAYSDLISTISPRKEYNIETDGVDERGIL